MASNELCGIPSLQVFVFNLNIDNLRSIDFFKLEYFVSERIVLVLKLSELIFVTIFKCFVVTELILKLIMFVVIGNF